MRQTVLERMGGKPDYLLSVGGLSDRDERRKVVELRIQERYLDKGEQGEKG